jgi:hypothetical protein
MTERFIKSPLFFRIGELIMPIVTWVVILLPIWLSPFHPAVVAYFIISFNLFFLYKSATTTYNAVISYREVQLNDKILYFEKLKALPDSKKIKHFLIVPNYKEPLYKLEATIDSFVKNDYPYKTVTLVLAFEKREDEAIEKEKVLKEV